MNNFFVYISDYAIPIVIFYIVIIGLHNKTEIFDVFLKGARDGLSIVVELAPTLIGLMVGIGVMRASGVFGLIVNIMEPVTSLIRFPSELLPLTLIKLFSSSAATSLLIDIFKEYGVDSYIGRLGAIIMSTSETVFYVLAVYVAAGGIKKTRYVIPGGLFATLVGVIIAVILMNL